MNSELQQLETEVLHRAAMEDGIIDILCGICMVAWAIMILFDAAGFGGITFAVCFPASLVLRKKIVEPRIGRVQLKKVTVKTKQLLLIGVFTFTAVAAIAVSGIKDSIQIENLGALMLGFNFAFIAAAISFIYRARRGYFYSLAIIAVFLITRSLEIEVRRDDLLLPLLLSGFIVMATGGTLLVRFIKKHPVAVNPLES